MVVLVVVWQRVLTIGLVLVKTPTHADLTYDTDCTYPWLPVLFAWQLASELPPRFVLDDGVVRQSRLQNKKKGSRG